MQRLFVVLAKLGGIVMLYWQAYGLWQQLAMLLYILASASSHQVQGLDQNGWQYPWPLLIGSMINFIAMLIMAWVLIIKPHWLARKLGIHEQDGLEHLDFSGLLPLGVKLIGLVLTVWAIPVLLKALVLSKTWSQTELAPIEFYTQIAPLIYTSVQLLLGLLLLLQTNKVVRLINWENKKL